MSWVLHVQLGILEVPAIIYFHMQEHHFDNGT